MDNEILTSPFVTIDLFSGAGGMAEGFGQAGFRPLVATDYDPMAARTFQYNHPQTPFLLGDIKEIDARELLRVAGAAPGEVDVICGGPPCQGFSLAGPRLSDDPRNQLFREFLRIVQTVQPRFFVFENVAGLLSMKGGGVLKAILSGFEDLGYACTWQVVNAADYGVPQNRPRVIIIGERGGGRPTLPKPTHCPTPQASLFEKLPPHVTVWDAISDLPSIHQGEGNEAMKHTCGPANEYQRARRGHRTPGHIYNHRATSHSDAIVQRYASIPEGGSAKDVPADLATKKTNYYRLSKSRPSRTITCNHRTDILHPTVPRGTTVREAARLQSFDDDYRFFGNLTRKAKYVTQDDQVGNAVPPLLARAIASHIRLSLEQEHAIAAE